MSDAPPAVPSLNLKEAQKKNPESKKSLSKRIAGSIKRLATPRGSNNDLKKLDTTSAKTAAEDVIDSVAKNVSEQQNGTPDEMVSEIKQTAEEVKQGADKAAADATSRLSNAASAVKEKTTGDSDKKKREEGIKRIVGVAVAVAAVLVAIGAGKKKSTPPPPPPPPPKKKGFW